MMFASSPSCTAATAATDDAIGTGQSGASGSGRNPSTVHQSPSSSRSILSSSSTPLASVLPPPLAGVSSSTSQSAVGDMWSGAFKALQNPTTAFMPPIPSASTSTAHAPPSSMPSLGLPFFQGTQLAGGSPHPQMMALYYQQLMQAALPSSNQQYAHAMQQFLQQLQQVAPNHQSTRHNTPDDHGSCKRENQLKEEEQHVKVNYVDERQHAISKLKMGPDGNARCPICEESMGLSASDWRSHVELELSSLKKLKESINTVRAANQGRDKTRSGNPGLGNGAAQRMNRELGLVTHRNLRMKRLAARPRVPAPLNVSSLISPSSGEGTSSQLKCSACGVCAEFLVISSNQLEGGRCWQCFGWRRQQPPSPASDSIPNDAERLNGVNPNDPPPSTAAPHNGSGQLHGGERTPESSCRNGNGTGEEETKDLKSWDSGFLNGLCCPAGEHRPPSKRPNGSDGAYDESCPTMVVKRSRIDSQ